MKTYWDEKFWSMWPSYQLTPQETALRAQEVEALEAAIARGIQQGKIEIADQVIEMKGCALFDGQVLMHLPRSFMLESTQDLAQAHEQVCYLDKHRSIFCGFNWLSHPLHPAHVEALAATMKTEMLRRQPSLQVVQEQTITVNQAPLSTLEWIWPAAHQTRYQILFVTILHQRPFIGSFQCNAEDVLGWQPIFGAVIRSMELRDEGK
jgi:hypothetical protein